MEKPIKLNLITYRNLKYNELMFLVDEELLPQVKEVVISKESQIDIELYFDNTVIYLVNEPATLKMLSNYFDIEKVKK